MTSESGCILQRLWSAPMGLLARSPHAVPPFAMSILAQHLGIPHHHASLVENEALIGAAHAAARANARNCAAARDLFHGADGNHSQTPAGADDRPRNDSG